MELQDFTANNFYFDDTVDPEINALLAESALNPLAAETELYLLRAHFIDSKDLHVIVALYAYFLQHQRWQDAFMAANKALKLSAKRLYLPTDWRQLTRLHIGQGVLISMVLTRFYLLAHKACATLELELGQVEEGYKRLKKLQELDSADRLALADLVHQAQDLYSEFYIIKHASA
jgi:hypothetical protein